MQNQEGFKIGDHILPAGDNEVFIINGFYILNDSAVIEIQPVGGGPVKIAHQNDMKLFTKLHPYRVPIGFVIQRVSEEQDVDG